MKPTVDSKQKIQIDIVSYRIQDSDSLNLNVYLRIPLKILVFKREKDRFIANINYTFNIRNNDTKAIVSRITENRSIPVSYYEDTRDVDKFFQIEVETNLPLGKYELFSIIQDIDSHNIFKNTTDLDVGNLSSISKLSAFYYLENEKYYISKVVNENVDTVWFEFQIDDVEAIGENILFNYKVLQDSTILDSSTVNVVGNQYNIYNLPIKISSDWEDELLFFIGNKGKFSSIKLFVESQNGTQLWSEKRKDILGVMEYLVSYSKYKNYSSMEDGELFKAVNAYWKSKDPTSDTKKNELLEEINNRIAYSNAKFSVMGIGWRSDMGKVYIIYGPPESIDRHYNTEFLYNYEIWYYSSGLKFTFSDRRNFGELKLVSEF